MTVDLDAVRGLLATAVPFAAHTGVEYEQLTTDSATVVLPERAETKNHVGTQHAGALFTAGESASGAAFTAAFAERLGELRPVVADASITYVAPARGRITATGALARPVSELRHEIEDRGRTRFDVAVELSDESHRVVATMIVAWHVTRHVTPAAAEAGR